MNNSDSIAHLVAAAAKARQLPSPSSLALRLPPSSRVWPAQVITRWSEGCHVRVAEKHDTILPADALPPDADQFGIRITRGGVVILPNA
jgi:hypothetical protein